MGTSMASWEKNFSAYLADNEESEWLASIDPSLLDKSNEEKQLDDSEISSFTGENGNIVAVSLRIFSRCL